MQVEFVLYDLAIDFFIEFAIIKEDCVHFLEFFDDEVALLDHRLDSDTSTNKILIDSDKLSQLFIINHIFESFDLILQTNH